MQMNHDFPQIKDIAASKSKNIIVVPNVEKEEDLILCEDLKEAVIGFFKFYAKRYELNNHLISVNVGRWQEIRLQPHQSIFTPEQKR